MNKKILLTGAAGKLGAHLREFLATACTELHSVDNREFKAIAKNEFAHMVDLADAHALEALLQGVDAVIHFAGYPREADWSTLIATNVIGVANLWEQSKQAGVGRMIYASSNHAVGMYPRSESIDESAMPRPDTRYGVTKVFMESLAGLYAAKHGLRGFGMRIGHCSFAPADRRSLSHWLHPDDLIELVRTGLDAEYENEIVFGLSANSEAWWRNNRAFALGFRPRHSADSFAKDLAGSPAEDRLAGYFQGGSFAAAEYDNPRFTPI